MPSPSRSSPRPNLLFVFADQMRGMDMRCAGNAEQVEQYRAADEAKRGKMVGFFVGQAMKASKGKANPQQVNELLISKVEG